MEDYSDTVATLGDRIALARQRQGLTEAQLARRLGLRTQTVANWEADRAEPRANKLQMLAGFLNVSMVWLMTGEGPGGPAPERGPEGAGGAGGLREAIAELRDLRLLQAQVSERLERLETRLRVAFGHA